MPKALRPPWSNHFKLTVPFMLAPLASIKLSKTWSTLWTIKLKTMTTTLSRYVITITITMVTKFVSWLKRQVNNHEHSRVLFIFQHTHGRCMNPFQWALGYNIHSLGSASHYTLTSHTPYSPASFTLATYSKHSFLTLPLTLPSKYVGNIPIEHLLENTSHFPATN